MVIGANEKKKKKNQSREPVSVKISIHKKKFLSIQALDDREDSEQEKKRVTDLNEQPLPVSWQESHRRSQINDRWGQR